MLTGLQRTISKLHAAGVTLIAGTDIAAHSDRVPGFSLQDELRALSNAGLTPLRGLQTATLHPAQVMGRMAAHGTVAGQSRTIFSFR